MGRRGDADFGLDLGDVWDRVVVGEGLDLVGEVERAGDVFFQEGDNFTTDKMDEIGKFFLHKPGFIFEGLGF